MTELRGGRRPYERFVYYLQRRHPTVITVGRFGLWSLGIVKRTLLGIGGVALLVVVGLLVAAALVPPLRWYLVGIVIVLLLIGGGALALFYIRSLLSSALNDQRKQISNIKKETADIKKEVQTMKDDVFIIVYDIVKEQGKLADRVSELETRAANGTGEEPPSHETNQ